jgi:hypothetical protein
MFFCRRTSRNREVMAMNGKAPSILPANLTPAATILNEPSAHPFPERLSSAHTAQLAEWVGVLPEAAQQKAS